MIVAKFSTIAGGVFIEENDTPNRSPEPAASGSMTMAIQNTLS